MAQVHKSVTLNALVAAAGNAKRSLVKLNNSYEKLQDGTGPIAKKAEAVIGILNQLYTTYGIQSAELERDIAAIATEADKEVLFPEESGSAQKLQDVLDKARSLKDSIVSPGTPGSGDPAPPPVPGTNAVAAAAAETAAAPGAAASGTARQRVADLNATSAAADPGLDGAFPGQGGGGFRYSAKKRRRTPSHKKTKVKRTSSKRKSASLRGGRKRTSRRTSRKKSHKKSRRTSRRSARSRSSHRRRKY